MTLIAIIVTLSMRGHFKMIKLKAKEQNFMVKRIERKQRGYFINQHWLKKFKNIMRMAQQCKNNNNNYSNP